VATAPLRINQDAHVFVADIAQGTDIRYSLDSNRAAWVHVVRGEVALKGAVLHTGDAAAVTGEQDLELSAGDAKSSGSCGLISPDVRRTVALIRDFLKEQVPPTAPSVR
jgi:redox-sensitive bicupin YhaK (pirin superfamily)